VIFDSNYCNCLNESETLRIGNCTAVTHIHLSVLTLFQLLKLGNTTWGEKLTMYGERERILLEEVVACFSVLSQHLPGEMEKNLEHLKQDLHSYSM
jgi:hypothetical protein